MTKESILDPDHTEYDYGRKKERIKPRKKLFSDQIETYIKKGWELISN